MQRFLHGVTESNDAVRWSEAEYLVGPVSHYFDVYLVSS